MQTTVRNDRDAIIAIVAEHYMANDKYLRKAKIRALADKPDGLDIIHHNSNWHFAYDSRSNIIYVAGSSL